MIEERERFAADQAAEEKFAAQEMKRIREEKKIELAELELRNQEESKSSRTTKLASLREFLHKAKRF